ncbi:MAG: hypothetical protein ACLPYS_20545 [Vulcanimicrobiaceae bacterium]
MKSTSGALRSPRGMLAEVCLAALVLAPVTAGAQGVPPPSGPAAPPTMSPSVPATYPPPTSVPATNVPQNVSPQNLSPQDVTPQGPAPAAAPETTLPGSALNAVLSSPDINTKSAKAGDGFTMVVVPPYPGGDQDFAQSTIHGHVADVTGAGQGRKASLKLAFDSITFASGQTQPISGSIIKIETKNEDTTARQALGAGAGAAVGSQTIGRILGGAFGSLVGILGGAVGGFLYGSNDKANFDVATGARATIQTSTPIEVPRRQAPAS